MEQLANVRFVGRVCRRQTTFMVRRSVRSVALNFGIRNLPSVRHFFIRRADETICDLLAALAGAGSTAEIERLMHDADSLDIAEFLARIEDAVRP